MSFLAKVQRQYKTVLASKGVIKTSEPIKIKWELDSDILVITVDGIDYAVVEHVSSIDEVDLEAVKEWVENTYFDDAYKSSVYIPARLKLKDFKKKVQSDVRKLRPEFDGLDEVGALLKGKKVKDGGVVKKFELKNLLGPTAEISVLYKLDGHPYVKQWHITKRKGDEYRIDYAHNKVRVGSTPEEAAKKIISLLKCPVSIEKKLGSYKGWDLYLTTKDERGMGGHAAKGSNWYGTDVSYTQKPDAKHIKNQLQLGIDYNWESTTPAKNSKGSK